MKIAKVKKVTCRFFSKDGNWQMTSSATLKKGLYWEIPYQDTKATKKLLVEKMDLVQDKHYIDKGYSIAFDFGHARGQNGVLVTNRELKKLIKDIK